MLREFFLSSRRSDGQLLSDATMAWLGLAVIVAHAFFTAYIKFTLNHWYSAFYDVLQTKSMDIMRNSSSSNATVASLAESREAVWTQLMSFFYIVAPFVVIRPINLWVKSLWALRWRLSLMVSYIERWDPTVPPIEGASQRLHEDTQRFSKGVETYLSVLLTSMCTLVAFTPILLSLGAQIRPPILLSLFGTAWLFVAACASAFIGLGVAMVAGRRLVDLEVENQRVEAEVRREAVVLEATPEVICAVPTVEGGIVGAAGAAGADSSAAVWPPRPLEPAPHFRPLWTSLLENYTALFRNFFGLNLWLECFDQVIVLAPYFLVAPLLFAEDKSARITLGTLMQTSNSFDKVFSSLSILSNNWGGINEWRSTVVRLKQFEKEQLAGGAQPLGGSKARASDASPRPLAQAPSDSETELSPMCLPESSAPATSGRGRKGF